MTSSNIRLCCMLVLMCAAQAGAATGTSGALIMSQPIGAKASSLAEAFTARYGDINCIYYNPAGLAFMKRPVWTVGYQQGVVDDSFGALSVAVPVKVHDALRVIPFFFSGRGTFAASIIYYTAGDIELYDFSLKETSVIKAQRDYMAVLTYALPVLGNLSLGANLKALRSTLVEEFTGTAYAFDLGVLYFYGGLSFGVCLRNNGSGLKYVHRTDPLPQSLRAGAAYRFMDAILSADMVQPEDGDPAQSIGLEYLVNSFLFLRGGLKNQSGSVTTTAGIGIGIKDITVDYGIEMFSSIGSTNKLSLSYRF